jgi:hypothetical protein
MKLVCRNCGREFERYRKRQFCSLVCANEFRKGKPQSLLNVWPPVMWTQVNAKCLVRKSCACGQPFSPNDYRQKYCSFECSCKFKAPFTDKHRKNLSINARKVSAAARTGFLCKNCGVEVVMRGSDARKRTYCAACLDKHEIRSLIARNGLTKAMVGASERMKGKNNPAFTHPETFKYKGCQYYADLGLRLRSGWEANVARIIKSWGCHFEYESETFLLSDGSTYTPDFYVHELDEIIEVKGRWIGNAKEKVEMFLREYPGLNFNLIGPKEYKALIGEFKDARSAQ